MDIALVVTAVDTNDKPSSIISMKKNKQTNKTKTDLQLRLLRNIGSIPECIYLHDNFYPPERTAFCG